MFVILCVCKFVVCEWGSFGGPKLGYDVIHAATAVAHGMGSSTIMRMTDKQEIVGGGVDECFVACGMARTCCWPGCTAVNHQLIPLQIQSMLWCALIDPRDGQRWIEKLEKVATLV